MSTAELRLADGTEVVPNLYVRDGLSLYKISTPSPHTPRPGSTVTVCRDGRKYPDRTTVRYLTAEQLAGMFVASSHVVNAYHKHLDGGS